MRRVLLLSLFALGACDDVEELAEWVPPPSNPREAYVRTLEDAGLASSALLADWVRSADQAIARAPTVTQSFRETVAIDLAGSAQAWQVPVRRGQRVVVRAEGSNHVFLDASDGSRTLGYGEPDAGTMEVEPRGDGFLIVRAQPPLLGTGRYRVTIQVLPTLGFPVADHGIADVGSVFGDPRDGGARDHHGIDIFAPRGTPVVAATAGTVSRVQVTARGGKVIWLRDARRAQNLYYAHLDSQLVSNGMRVQPGDTLGLVGNTGNARTTPPHLHFGIYSRGPQDPVPFVLPVRDRPTPLPPDSGLVGTRVRVASALELRPSPGGEPDTPIERGTLLRVEGATASWLRVTTPDGNQGFVRASETESIERPLERVAPDQDLPVHAAPSASAPTIATLAAGRGAPVYARSGSFAFVRLEDGREGWVTTTSAN